MWKVVVKGYVAFPGDLLVGAYYPWFENIPVKNPLISDVFSQIYSWKHLIANSYLKGQVPLWNQYSFSGYPLLATFHSGALYPLNALLLGDFNFGWNLILFSQLALAGIGMYFFLRLLKYSVWPSLIAAAAFAFSGFYLTMWQVGFAGHTMAWLIFALIVIQLRRFWLWPIFFFLAVTAGHFQAAVYFLIVTSSYYLFKNRSLSSIFKWIIVVTAGVLLASPQLLPTFELTSHSVRFEEGYIQKQNFGLLPWSHLATLIAPDFFGNATTYNYWGAVNYQESIFYVGILGAIALILATWHLKDLSSEEKFFYVLAVVTLALGFSSPIGKLIYWLKIPALSTSSASRVFMLMAVGTAILTARLLSKFKDIKITDLLKVFVSIIFLLAMGFTGSWAPHTHQIIRNLIFPGLLCLGIVIAWTLRKTKHIYLLMFLIVVSDLFRFGWKYNPFVKKDLVFPTTTELSFLQTDQSYFRVDRENGPVLPPNTWEDYALRSASGYDPVSLRDYARGFHQNLNAIPNSTATRYTELSRYSATDMGLYGIKYLLVRNNFVNKLDPFDWHGVFQTPSMTVLENTKNKSLAYFENSNSKIDIVKWESQDIEINTHNPTPDYLTVTTNYYPGWTTLVNGKPVQVAKTSANFQKIYLETGDNNVIMHYFPRSFGLGLVLGILGAFFTLLGLFSPKLIKLRS